MTHNFLGPRVPLGKENNIKAWREISTGHPDDQWIIQSIEYELPLQYRGPAIINTFGGNHPSAVQYPNQVNSYIQKEV